MDRGSSWGIPSTSSPRKEVSESLTPQLNVDHEDASEAASEAANLA
jgi:hypothetical protein